MASYIYVPQNPALQSYYESLQSMATMPASAAAAMMTAGQVPQAAVQNTSPAAGGLQPIHQLLLNSTAGR